jgi:hypothetical protein
MQSNASNSFCSCSSLTLGSLACLHATVIYCISVDLAHVHVWYTGDPGGPGGNLGQQQQVQHQQHLAAERKQYVAKQQRWLLFLRHCAKCQAPDGQCQYGNSCQVAKALWRHILTCSNSECHYPRWVSRET